MSGPAKVEVRHVATRALPPVWNVLLPQDPISMVGRVPSKDSIKHLSDARLSPKMEIIVVAFTCDPAANEDEKNRWNGMIEDHLKRESVSPIRQSDDTDDSRHGLYHPYGDFKRNPIPAGAARELYLIPLRTTDPAPEFTELIDGFDLPPKRAELIYLGVFVIHRDDSPQSRPPAPVAPSIPSASAIPHIPFAPVGNPDIQALLAKLDTKALGSLASLTPPQPSQSPLAGMQQGGYPPSVGYYPTQGVQGYQQQQGYDHHQGGGYYDPRYAPHQGNYGYEGYASGSHGQGEYDQGRQGMGGYERRDQRGGEHGGRGMQGRGGRNGGGGGNANRERDNGWGSRR